MALSQVTGNFLTCPRPEFVQLIVNGYELVNTTFAMLSPENNLYALYLTLL